MNSKLVLVVLAFACLAGVALSASVKDERLVGDGLESSRLCDFCQKMVNKLKESGQTEQVRETLENFCKMSKDPKAVERCLKNVDHYAEVIETKTTLEACTEFKYCP